MSESDLVVRGGTVATGADLASCDLAVKDGRIVALGHGLPPGAREIDATGLLVLPGGIDSHVHVEQHGNPGGPFTDSFVSATTSAACGGTTTIISHARQMKGESLASSVADYEQRAKAAVIDYAFHMMVTDPTAQVLEKELPLLVEAGHTSVKFFTASARNVLNDEQILPLMARARDAGAFVVVHAENDAATNWLTNDLLGRGLTHPRHNAASKPPEVEREAVHRICTFAEILGMPVQIFHVTSEAALEEIERAQRRGAQVYGETCPQYLVLTEQDLDRPVEEAVKFIFGPPPRRPRDQERLWSALRRGVLNTVSSDHAPFPYSGPGGKLEGVAQKGFATTPHGIPGLETRLPILFSEGVQGGRISLARFVEITATNPARMFGLYPRKGGIMVGGDADLAIWDPGLEVTIRNSDLRHRVEYTPYEGLRVTGWPRHVVSRGEIVVMDRQPCARSGRGQWIKRAPLVAGAGPWSMPIGALSPSLGPRNALS